MKRDRAVNFNIKKDFYNDTEFKEYITDLIQNDYVLSMGDYTHHKNMSRLEHCLYVSYKSYRICKRFGFDYRAAARGALLHDFFLYDTHTSESHEGMHWFKHPSTALENATKYFDLNSVEKDIIEKHMWPITIKLPKYKESFIVMIIDKYCSTLEMLRLNGMIKIPVFSSEV